MDRTSRLVFLLLVLLQAAHSFEEYSTGLYDTFEYIQSITELVAGDRARGFAILNSAFVVFGLWCYLVPIRRGWPSARGWAWLWVVIELFNGILHPGLALSSGGYFPGVITAPLLFVVAAWLAVRLSRIDAHGTVNEPTA